MTWQRETRSSRSPRTIIAIALVVIVALVVAGLAFLHLYDQHQLAQAVTEPTTSTAGTPTGSVTPTATPTPTPTTPSFFKTVPGDELPGWKLVTRQDFKRDAPLGQFEQIYGHDLAGYNLIPDHSSRGTGLYAPARVLSVADGTLTYNLHADANHGYVAAPEPTGNNGQKYGRYIMRFRADLTPGYRIAFLLWPDDSSPSWENGGGEIDMAETNLDGDAPNGGTIMSYSHNTQGDPKINTARQDWGVSVTDWHTMDVQWTPKKLTMTLDGKSFSTTAPAAIPQHKMRWVLQAMTNATKVKPDASVTGKVQVAWFAQYAYDPGSK